MVTLVKKFPHQGSGIAYLVRISRPRVYRVEIKIPPFCKTEPKFWFLQIKAQFARTMKKFSVPCTNLSVDLE